MPLLIKKAHDPISIKSVKTLLFGQPGVRKTSYAFTAPRALLIDCDGGIRRVSPQYRGDYIEVHNWEDIAQLLDEDLSDYDTLIFDTVSKMLDFLTDFVIRQDSRYKQRDGSLTQKGYGALGIRFKEFKGRIELLNKNIVYVAHDKENRVGEEVTIRPDIVGQNLGTIIKDCDLVGYMEMYNNLATVAFSPTDRHYGKNTCGLPDRVATSKLPLSAIFEQYQQSVNQENEELRLHRQQMAEVQTMLDKVMTSDELNQKMEQIKGMNFVLNGKTVAAQMVNTKAAELAFEFDKVKKLYYSPFRQAA